MRSPGRTIAIIGAGFSGTVLAVNLLRRDHAQPTRIIIIEPRAELGRGVAYQSDWYPHLLNVPAERMSAESREPLQFARFAQARDARHQADEFLPRRLYGEYLQQLLQSASQSAPPPLHCSELARLASHLVPLRWVPPQRWSHLQCCQRFSRRPAHRAED